ncbi:MAG: phosphate uptake regulator PhoU [Thermofilum sp.]|uniref:Phosphate uptake regulator, PhoU n=1 Tax=Thermofilum adornatum 1505 TaxID=697581 RepID=A0A3G1A5D8_9CREN|nr:phosphate uptake regulator PhoU [Thermofilum adornatum]AJB41173.1 phosphate uptake regulator, PhoU [Thermofilum adornatum 1505]
MPLARKLIRLGKASLAVTLPSKWLKKHDLKEGQDVYIEDRDDYLEIWPKPREAEEIKQEAQVEIEPGEEKSAERIIISYYSAGYTSIRISYPKKTNKTLLKENIRRSLLRLVGLEAFEEEENYFLLQMIADTSTISIEKIISRMELLLKNNLRDLEEYARTGHMQYLKSIIERDEELDKFYFLLSRQVALSLKSSSYAEKVGIPQRPLLLPYFNYAKTLERLGDVFVSLARILQRGQTVTEEQVEIIKKAVTCGINAFQRGDKVSKKELGKLYSSFFTQGKELTLITYLIGNVLSLSLDLLEARVDFEALTPVQK